MKKLLKLQPKDIITGIVIPILIALVGWVYFSGGNVQNQILTFFQVGNNNQYNISTETVPMLKFTLLSENIPNGNRFLTQFMVTIESENPISNFGKINYPEDFCTIAKHPPFACGLDVGNMKYTCELTMECLTEEINEFEKLKGDISYTQ